MRTNIFTRFSAVVCMLTAMAAAPSESLAINITINKTDFPDDIFRQYVLNNCDADKNQSLSDQEIAGVTTLFINNMDIADLTGIGYFTALNHLICEDNKLTALDVSKNTALTKLDCSNNQLTALDLSHNTALTELDCGRNQLTALDLSHNTALKMLWCNVNQLTSLDLSHNTALTFLCCDYNQLTALDLSHNTALTELYCTYNRISGEAMDALIEGLPVITDSSGFDGTFCVFGLGSQEQNVVTKSQVSAAIAKGWTVLTDSYGTYEGSDGSTFISSLSGDSRNLGAYDCWYDLQGRRLNVKPTSRGIYIRNGKKVILKD